MDEATSTPKGLRLTGPMILRQLHLLRSRRFFDHQGTMEAAISSQFRGAVQTTSNRQDLLDRPIRPALGVLPNPIQNTRPFLC